MPTRSEMTDAERFGAGSTDVLDVTIDPHNKRGWPRNRRQREWARRVVIEGENAYQAALGAGYRATTARSKSGEFARRLGPFLTYLQQHKNAVAKTNLHVTTERVVQELAAIALADRSSYYVTVMLKGGIARVIGRAPDELSPWQWAAIKTWTVVEREGAQGIILDYQYIFIDRVKPLTALAKCLGLFNERIQIELLQGRSAHERQDYSNVSDEALLASIERLERMKADLERQPQPLPASPSDEARRLVHTRVMSSAA